MNILVIIPCYNEAENIVKTISALQKAIRHITEHSITPLVINDCSTDDSIDKIKSTGVNFIDLPINLGIGGGMQTGYLYAQKHGFDIAIQLDGDGQHDPDYLQHIITPIANNEANVVIGSRYINKTGFQSSSIRRFGIKYFSKLNKLLVGIKVLDATSGFRALDKKAIKEVCLYYPEKYPEPESIILYAMKGLTIKEVPVVMKAREGGKSSITGLKTAFYMFKVTLGTLFLYIRLKSQKK